MYYFVFSKLELESWDSWGQDEDRNAQNHAKQHGHLYGRQNSNDQEEEDIDYFSDMTPRFKKATKVSYKKSLPTLTGFKHALKTIWSDPTRM